MSYKIYPTPDFKKYFKKLYKKYPSLKDDLQELINQLETNPQSGTSLVHIYDKNQLENISKQQIFELLKNADLL